MSHAFLSYKREDELIAGRIALALEAEGIDLWWDRGLPHGESWHTTLEAKLDGAGCVVVIWSRTSTGTAGSYVRDEARRGLARDVLVPIVVEGARIPLGFGEAQAIDLGGWQGDRTDPFFEDLVAAIRAKLAGTAMPAPKGPLKRFRQRLFYSVASAAGLASIITIGFNAFGSATTICTIPAAQPGLSDACGAMGLGGRPARAERLAWEARPKGSCRALRDHVARFPKGVYRREASELVATRRITTTERWLPTQRSLNLFVGAGPTPAANEAGARARTLEGGKQAAERLCRDFGSGTLYRYVSAAPRARSWSCTRDSGGALCSFDGEAVCGLEQRDVATTESCG